MKRAHILSSITKTGRYKIPSKSIWFIFEFVVWACWSSASNIRLHISYSKNWLYPIFITSTYSEKCKYQHKASLQTHFSNDIRSVDNIAWHQTDFSWSGVIFLRRYVIYYIYFILVQTLTIVYLYLITSSLSPIFPENNSYACDGRRAHTPRFDLALCHVWI